MSILDYWSQSEAVQITTVAGLGFGFVVWFLVSRFGRWNRMQAKLNFDDSERARTHQYRLEALKQGVKGKTINLPAVRQETDDD